MAISKIGSNALKTGAVDGEMYTWDEDTTNWIEVETP